jgi:hypothetical protein
MLQLLGRVSAAWHALAAGHSAKRLIKKAERIVSMFHFSSRWSKRGKLRGKLPYKNGGMVMKIHKGIMMAN